MVAWVGVASDLGNFNPKIATLILSLLPVIEPRYAVVIGATFYGLSLFEALLISAFGVILLSLSLTLFLELLLISALRGALSRINIIKRVAEWLSYRSLAKTRKTVKKYGLLGLILFVAVPLPMTGIYTGSIAGLLLGFNKKELFIALIIGGYLSLLITVAGIGITRLP